MARPPRPPARVLAAALILAAGLAFGPRDDAGLSGPSTATPTPAPQLTHFGWPTPAPPPRDIPTRDPNAPTRTVEEELSARATHIATAEAGGSRWIASGPETRGATITVRRRQIELPDDAYVVRVISTVTCPAPPQCPEPPIITLRRGDSTISVSQRTGAVVHRESAPGEEDAFRFLLDASR